MEWKWSYLLNFDAIFTIIVVIAVLYFVLTSKRRKYDFHGYNGDIQGGIDVPRNLVSKKKKKKKRKLNKHEEKCREIFERLFGARFKSVRPDWLKNPVSGKNLELDGFCPEVSTSIGKGLAMEYDGRQHSKYTPHFHRKGGVQEFAYQVKKDHFKDLKCRERGILLIRIPHYVAFEDLERYITTKCKKNGLGSIMKTRNINSGGLYG